MTDMLVRLYDHSLESHPLVIAGLRIQIKRAMAADKSQVCGFVATNFGDTAAGWVSECEVALTGLPSSCFIAVHDNTLIGFCCYDATAKGMLGPLGVRNDFRCKGVAQELLYHTVEGMKAAGYAYAIIGWVHSEAYYQKTCDAITIPGSFPGIYSRLIEQGGDP